MNDEDRKATRSPSIDLNEYKRLKLERAVANFEASKKPLGSEGQNKLSQGDFLKAQGKFAAKQERSTSPISSSNKPSEKSPSLTEPSAEMQRTAGGSTYLERLRSRSQQKNAEVPKTTKISYAAAFFLIGTAIIIDALQFIIGYIPILGQIVGGLMTIGATFGFWLWFKILGVKFSKKQNMGRVIGIIIEYIPVVNMLPTWTLTVGLLILREKMPSKINSSLQKTIPLKKDV